MTTSREHYEQTKFEAALADLPKHNEDLCCPRCGEEPSSFVAQAGNDVVRCVYCSAFDAPVGIGNTGPAAWRDYRLSVAAYIAEHGDRFGQCVRGGDVPGALATIGAILGSLVVFLALMVGAVALVLALGAYVMGAVQ